MIAYARGDPLKAIGHWKRINKGAVTYSRALHGLVLAYRAAGKKADAEKARARLRNVDPALWASLAPTEK